MVQVTSCFTLKFGVITLFYDICCRVWVKMDGSVIVDSCHSGDIDFLVPLREQQESVFISINQLSLRIHGALKGISNFIGGGC